MTTPEILWLVHTDNIRSIKENEPHKLRPYLIEMGDEATLRDWDNEQMKAKSEPGTKSGRR